MSFKDNGVRNLFALIQSVREAQAEGEVDAYDYQEDEGNWDAEEAVPDEAPPADDEDEYEDEWGQEEEDERSEGGGRGTGGSRGA